MTSNTSTYQQKYPEIYYETPVNYYPIVDMFVTECYDILDKANLPRDTIQFLQIKSKFGKLRIYTAINRLYDDDISGLEESTLLTLRDLIDRIVDKYEAIKMPSEDTPIN